MMQQSVFHSANMMIDNNRNGALQGTVDTIAQLVIATASDHRTVMTLTATNSKLTMQLEASQAYIKKLNEEIADLNVKMKPAWQGQIPTKMTINDNYLWSHGYQNHKDHTSASCKAPKDGHKTATKSNMMDGVKSGKEVCGGAAEVIDHKVDQFAFTLYTPSY
jgi:hypothetical protein